MRFDGKCSHEIVLRDYNQLVVLLSYYFIGSRYIRELLYKTKVSIFRLPQRVSVNWLLGLSST